MKYFYSHIGIFIEFIFINCLMCEKYRTFMFLVPFFTSLLSLIKTVTFYRIFNFVWVTQCVTCVKIAGVDHASWKNRTVFVILGQGAFNVLSKLLQHLWSVAGQKDRVSWTRNIKKTLKSYFLHFHGYITCLLVTGMPTMSPGVQVCKIVWIGEWSRSTGQGTSISSQFEPGHRSVCSYHGKR